MRMETTAATPAAIKLVAQLMRRGGREAATRRTRRRSGPTSGLRKKKHTYSHTHTQAQQTVKRNAATAAAS